MQVIISARGTKDKQKLQDLVVPEALDDAMAAALELVANDKVTKEVSEDLIMLVLVDVKPDWKWEISEIIPYRADGSEIII